MASESQPDELQALAAEVRTLWADLTALFNLVGALAERLLGEVPVVRIEAAPGCGPR